jgi:Xaa-Pro aminopeptidase
VARYFQLDEYHDRWKKVHAMMTQKGYDYALIWGKTGGTYERAGDVLYLANYYSTHSGHEPDSKLWNGRAFSAILMRPGEVPELHTDEAGAPRLDIVATDRVEWHWDVPTGVGQALARQGIAGRVALAGTDFLPVKYMRQLQAAAPDVEFVPEDDLVRNIRRIKSRRELECFREGGEIVTRGLNRLMEALVAGRTEAEAAAAGAAEVIRAGGNYHRIPISHGDSIDFFERNPLNGYSTDAPARGDLVRAWIYGPIWQGYWLDPGRTATCGSDPTHEQRRLTEACVGLCEALRARIRPGVRVKEIAALGDQLTRESGYASDQAKEMWPYYGHGNGCMWEPPFIEVRACEDDEVFEANMVGSVEAFLSKDGVGAAGFETNYIVTDNGTEVITTSPNFWW